MNRYRDTHRPGFTIVEMIVVLVIIMMTVVVAFPAIRAMKRTTAVSNGVNSVSVAITTARAYAVRNKTQGFINLRTPTGFHDGPALYSGVAAIFTPAGEIRLTENTAAAWDFVNPENTDFAVWPLERLGPTANDIQPVNQTKKELNGFVDLNIDYMLLPSDTGVAGIWRNNNSGVPQLIAPPFALWFDSSGHLVVGNAAYQHVYYNGNYQNGWETGDDRLNYIKKTGKYDPKDYDPEAGAGHWNDTVKKYELPFEKIETVIGMFTYSKAEFDLAGLAWGGVSTKSELWDWMKQNGQILLFSRQAGTLMREPQN